MSLLEAFKLILKCFNFAAGNLLFETVCVVKPDYRRVSVLPFKHSKEAWVVLAALEARTDLLSNAADYERIDHEEANHMNQQEREGPHIVKFVLPNSLGEV